MPKFKPRRTLALDVRPDLVEHLICPKSHESYVVQPLRNPGFLVGFLARGIGSVPYREDANFAYYPDVLTGPNGAPKVAPYQQVYDVVDRFQLSGKRWSGKRLVADDSVEYHCAVRYMHVTNDSTRDAAALPEPIRCMYFWGWLLGHGTGTAPGLTVDQTAVIEPTIKLFRVLSGHTLLLNNLGWADGKLWGAKVFLNYKLAPLWPSLGSDKLVPMSRAQHLEGDGAAKFEGRDAPAPMAIRPVYEAVTMDSEFIKQVMRVVYPDLGSVLRDAWK